MKQVEVLRKIVEDSTCSWGSKRVCALCPLSKLKQKEDGSYMSCIEAIGAHTMTGKDIDERYKEVATKLLVDMEFDAILEQE